MMEMTEFGAQWMPTKNKNLKPWLSLGRPVQQPQVPGQAGT